ncbi:cobalt ECF transporter T component CbiQ [Alkaliphilus sp. B6464]|uniref:cobalt ECF transporter T component CbiQ n=1 Tax=Alkaliphilus sp. B6464 TaxID=2731219 RepID=UPI001BAC2172|nr:cobalt ECF transporter T component CbiQ [Alkaliphilus sp. B6464]
MAKFIFAIGALNIAVLINNLYINISIFFIMAFLTTFVANIPFNKYFKILIIPFGFLAVSIITILIGISNVDIFIWSIKIWNKYIGITYQSLIDVLHIIMRVLAAISSTFFLGLTTPLNNIIKVLKKIKIPNLLIELLVLIYRFIFIFLKEANEIYTIQEMKFGYTGFKNSYRSVSLLIKHLFVRVLTKYESMVIALDSKLYDGEFKIGD